MASQIVIVGRAKLCDISSPFDGYGKLAAFQVNLCLQNAFQVNLCLQNLMCSLTFAGYVLAKCFPNNYAVQLFSLFLTLQPL
jgi:hypothetical protein